MYDPSRMLADWLAAVLHGYSTTLWNMVSPLAGGPEGPLWRWVVVEQGLFLLLLFLGAWWVRMVVGIGRIKRTTQHWGTAAVFACGFSLLWNWYGLVASQAIQLGLHPRYGWEWTFFTWGLPYLVASGVFPALAFLAQFGVALALGALGLVIGGRIWAGAPGPSRRR